MNNLALVENNELDIEFSEECRYIDDLSRYNKIALFLIYKRKEATQKKYRRNILEFFNFVYKQGFEYVEQIEDRHVERIEPRHAFWYEQYVSKKYAQTTASGKISTMKSLYDFFLGTDFSNVYKTKWLVGNPFQEVIVEVNTSNIDRHKPYSRNEVVRLLKVAKMEDALLYEMAIRTGVRKGALLRLTIHDIVKVDGVWCITGIDKGDKRFTDSITDEMYEKCKVLSMRNKGDKIFSISASQVNNRLNDYLKKIGLWDDKESGRKLTFHSFKKTTIKLGWEWTNDMTVLKEKGHHSTITTTMDIYNEVSVNKGDDIGLLYDLENEDDSNDEENCGLEDVLSNMSKEEMMQMIMGNSSVKNQVKGLIKKTVSR